MLIKLGNIKIGNFRFSPNIDIHKNWEFKQISLHRPFPILWTSLYTASYKKIVESVLDRLSEKRSHWIPGISYELYPCGTLSRVTLSPCGTLSQVSKLEFEKQLYPSVTLSQTTLSQKWHFISAHFIPALNSSPDRVEGSGWCWGKAAGHPVSAKLSDYENDSN